jgi:hypothetical protein
MNTQSKTPYAPPLAEVWEVKTESSFLQMSQQNYTYRSLDEPDDDVNG